MCVRLLALLSIVLGILIYSGKVDPTNMAVIGSHFLFGFILVGFVLALAIVALLNKLYVPGILGVLLSIGVPISGFKQIATIGPHMGAPQVTHLFLVLLVLGIAEMSAGKLKRIA